MALVMGDKIIFEKVPCWNCGGTKQTERGVLCPEWNHKVRGRLGGHCPHCGATNRHQHKVLRYETVECYYCSGTGKQMETCNSHITENVYSHLTYKVYRERETRDVDDIDDLIDMNNISRKKNIGGCTDYGVSAKRGDEEIIKSVDKIHRWSYLQIADEDNMLCREVAIVVGKYGYSVRSIF